ncbi:hypothetical protein phiOC_p209 [Ochrobactrum phage vB_OspM_OC]|nr:hypothetical protein phiOC_p209 [Ochrobactrum phage vB_OspM_OC]
MIEPKDIFIEGITALLLEEHTKIINDIHSERSESYKMGSLVGITGTIAILAVYNLGDAIKVIEARQRASLEGPRNDFTDGMRDVENKYIPIIRSAFEKSKKKSIWSKIFG